MSRFSIENALPWRVRIWLREAKTRYTLKAVAKIPHPRARDLCRAIEKTVTKRYSDEELAVIAAIEHLREKCIGSCEEIEFIDYGAGEPSDPRSLEESRRGQAKKIGLSHLAAHTSKKEPWSHLLFNLVRELRPQRCLELGTCIGFSAAHQCAAMTLNGYGLLVTLEGAVSFAARAKEHLQRVGVKNFNVIVGRFEDTLETALVKYSPFDFMFNDGHHDGQAMLSYFDKCLPSFSNDAVLLFDDIGTYPSMRDAWQQLWKHEHVAFVVDFGPMGIVGLRRGKRSPASVFHLAL